VKGESKKESEVDEKELTNSERKEQLDKLINQNYKN
jgi:hypothetical protein